MFLQPSVRVDPWTEEFDATHLGKICVQTGSFKNKGRPEGFWDKLYSLGNNMTDDPNPNDPDPENCLNLNVYTTNVS
jgi:carboxylesterase type B